MKPTATFIRVILWCISLALTNGMLGQDALALEYGPDLSSLFHRLWGLEEGLPQASPRPIIQSSDGYIWFGTEEGLVRFDGVKFTVFNPKNSAGLTGKVIQALAEDEDKNLWVGFEGGLARFDGRSFKSYFPEHGLASGNVRAVFSDSKNRLWVGTWRGLQLLENDKFKTWGLGEGLVDERIKDIAEDQTGALWIGTQGGVAKFEQGVFTNYTTKEGLINNIVNDLEIDHKGTVWCATEAGVSAIYPKSIVNYSREAGFPADKILSVLEDSKHNLWFGTQQGGFGVLANGKFHNQGPALNMAWGVIALFEDKEGSLWVGSRGEGLHQFRQGKVTTLFPSGVNKQNIVVSAFIDKEETLWVGTTDGLAKRTARGFELFDVSFQDKSGIPMVIADAQDGGLWVGGTGIGVARFKNGKILRVVNHLEHGLSSDSVRAIYEDGLGNLWIGTIEGYNHFRNGQLVKIYTKEDGLPAGRVSIILPDDRGGQWLGTPKGLSYFDGTTFTNYKLSEDTAKNNVLFMYRENEERLWIGTTGGLALFSNGQVAYVSEEHGLHNNKVFSIFEDRQGTFWMSCNDGIFASPKQQLLDFISGKIETVTAEHLGVKDGMKNRECNGGYNTSAAVTKSGQIWFATMDGVVRVDPATIKPNQVPPLLAIENVKATRKTQSVEVEGGDELQAGTDRIEFHYTGLSFAAPKEVTFSYRLHPFDKDWVDAGHKRMAQYTNLEPGEYTFEVGACNEDKVCSKESASISFVLEPFFYQTVWFVLLIVVLSLLILGSILLIWVKLSEKRQRELNEFAWERTRKVLHGQVDSIRKVAINVTNVSSEMQSLVSSLVAASGEVAASMTETATTIEEIGQTGKNTEANARRIVEAAKNAEANSVKGVQAVEQSTHLMQTIEQDSLSIGERVGTLISNVGQVDIIVSMVKGIADRSKILAINASIEAAKAGSAGLGFGVVADRMKALAIQSKESTMEIAGMLGTIRRSAKGISSIAEKGQQSTHKGVDAIDRTGTIVNDLTTELKENANLAEMIAQSIAHQLLGLSHITKAAHEIDLEMRDNSSKSQQMEAGIKEMTESVMTLHDLIDNWKTPEFYQ